MTDKFQTVAEFEAATGGQVTEQQTSPDVPKFATVKDWESDTAKTELQKSFYSQAEKTPDRQAEILRLSKEQNLPPTFVERNYDDLLVKSRRKAADFSELAEGYPGSTEFLKDPANTALARDDLENLKETEGAIKKHLTLSELIVGLMGARQEREREGEQSTWDWITDAYAVGQAKIVESALKVPAFLDTSYRALTGTPAREGKNPLLDNELLATAKGVGSLYRANVPEIDKSVSDLIGKGDYATAGKALVAQGLSNAHPQVVSLMVGLGSTKLLGAAVPGITTAADVSAESKEKGASDKQAALNATLQGSIEVVAERLGTFGLLDHWEKSLTKTYSKQVAGEVLKEFFKPLVASALGEASEEAITSLAQDFSSYATGVDKNALVGAGQRAIDAGIGGAFMGVVMGSVGAAGKAQARAQYLRQAESAKEMYSALGASSEASKVRERLPSKHRELVEKITQNGPVENLYIPVEEFKAYFQSKGESPAAFADKIGARQAFDEAQQTGSDVEVKLAQWTEGVVGTEHYEAFADNVKFSPGDLTVKQAKAAQGEAKKAVAETDAESTKDQAGEIVRGFEAQLKDLGVADPKQARLLAGLGGLASREGMNPKEFFDELNLSIGRGETAQAGAGVFNQPGDYPALPVEYDEDSDEMEIATADGKIRASSVHNLPQALSNDDLDGVDLEDISNPAVKNFATKYEGEYVVSVDWVKVEEGSRGSGKGAQFLDSLLKEAFGRGAKAVVLNASPVDGRHLDALIPFYESRGFKVVDRSGDQNATMILEFPDYAETFSQSDETGVDAPPRGQIKFGAKSVKIELFEKMDYSTFIHETGHLYLEALKKLSSKEGASEQTQSDLKTVLEWLGVESADQIKTEQHEKFADGFMNFVAEGKAPTKALRGVFRRFKLWVLSVANKLRVNGVELTPEVRDVMSRMLVSEQEVSKAEQSMEYGPLFDAPIAAGMNEEQALKYRRAVQEARDFAASEVNAGLMRELKKRQSVEQRAARKEIETEVTKEVNESRAFRALSILQKGKLPDGTEVPADVGVIKIDRAYLTDDQVKMLPRGIYGREGMSPDIAATVLGFPDGPLLLETLAATPKQSVFIKAETEKRLNEQFPDLMTAPVLPEKAVEALHNERRADMLVMELEHLASESLPQLKEAIRRIGRRPPRVAEVRAEAENLVGAKALSQLKPHLYRNAEIKAAKDAAAFLASGDVDQAFLAKRKELLNHELFRAAVDAKAQVLKATEKFKDIASRSEEDISKTRDVDIANAAKAVISQLQRTDPVAKKPDEYLAKLKQYDPETFAVVMTLVDSALEFQGDPRDLSFDDFMDITDSVSALWSLAKSSKQIEIDGKKVDREEVTKELKEKLVEYGGDGRGNPGYNKKVSEKQKAEMKLLGARAALTRTEQWADTVDVEDNGPFRRFIYEPIAKATSEYRLTKGAVLKSYESILKEWAKSLPKESAQPIQARELGYTFENKTELIGALLHTGNESNLSKLLRGRQWGELEDDGHVSRRRWDEFTERMINSGTLTKEDFDFVQKVWDLLEDLKPGAQKAHKSVYGYYFNEITANEFENKFGKYRGGYVPAKVDQYASEDARIRKEREEFEKNNNSFQFPTTGRGFTKSRTDSYAAPLSLDINLVGGHIDAVLRFTHIEPRVKEVARIVNDESFRAHLSEFLDPVVASEMLVPWLQRAATQKVVLPSEDGLGKILDPIARFLRKNVAMQFMVGNVTNAAQQFTGLIVAAAKVKPKYLRNAVATYVGSIKGTTNIVVEKSAFMRSTQGSNIYETQQAIEQILVNPSWLESTQDFASKHTYFLQSATQNVVNTIVWTGAYEQSIAEGNVEEQAIKDGDRAVRLTQGTNLPEDISRFETGTATKRLFTQFAGYFNMLANLNGGELMKISRDVGLKKGAGRAFYIYLTAFALPAIVSELMVRAMSGEPPDEDDDDSYLDDGLSVFFGSQFNTLTAMIPWGGQVANTALKRFNEKQYDDRLSLSPVVSTLESMAGIPAEIYKAINDDTSSKKKVVKDVLFLMGVTSSLPIGPIGKPTGYLMDVSSGDAEPSGPIDFTRGLISGKKGKQ
jgi:GNAT superfamily N-acetyltransferase